jgi:peptidoglycan hydrolase CwlO-like protein
VCNASALDDTDITSTIDALQQQVRGLMEHRATVDKTIDSLKISNQKEVSSLKEEIENLR